MTEPSASLDQQLWDFVYAYDAAYDAAARAVGLSAAQACLLDALTGGSRAMGELATELLCDASNVTQLAARLQARGLVSREPDPADRRVKRLSITPAGRQVHQTVRAGFDFPADRLRRLSEPERRELSRLMSTLLA